MDSDEKTKDYKEELSQIEDSNNENIEDIKPKEKKPVDTKKITFITICSILIILCIICVIILIVNNKKDNTETNITNQIQRPDESLEYTALKQSVFNISCKKTNTQSKYKKLTKGLIIDCEFNYDLNSNQKVSELYFDLNNSANVKLNNIKNETEHELINNGNLYKLTTKNPESVLQKSIHFYFEVLNDTDETGYVELANIVFKDNNNKYYKVINTIETFPPEYDDKIYIYKDIYNDENEEIVYYYSSKVKYNDREIFDTFQCKNESCDIKTENNTYFLIHDESLLIYDTIKKTSLTLNIPNDLKIEDYSYEIMLNPKGKIYGIAFKKDYVSAYDCESNDLVCINTGLSGYEIGYYSMALNNFSISLDYGFIGSSAYDDYDIALMLKKDNKIGIFSYEDDNMMLELSDKYKSIEYDDETKTIMLEVYDEKNNNYYFEFFNPKYSLFTVDTQLLEKYDNSNIYYKTAYNSKGIRVTMLFDNKGNSIKKLPYVISDRLISVSNKIITKDDYYTVYDSKGNKLYKSVYDPQNVLAYTDSYVIANNENKMVLLDSNGDEITKIKDLNEGIQFVSAKEEEKGILVLIIKDSSIKEEGKNAYKYTIEINKPFQTETILVD